jgi:protein-tyrosine sulfotransferase
MRDSEREEGRSVDTPQPFFILNVPRSGSTLLCFLLDAHPSVSVFIESSWFSSHTLKLQRLKKYPPWLRDESICQYLKDATELERLVEDEVAVRQAVSKSRGEPGAIFEYLCMNRSRGGSGDNSVWGEKTCAHALYVKNIRKVFPDGKFIHLIRDPRATIYSMTKKSFSEFSDSLLINLHVWKRYYDGIKRSLEDVPESNKLTVYYEDFVTDSEAQAIRICKFIGIDFDPDMLLHHKLNKQVPRGFGSEKATCAISTSFINEWKRSLSPLQVACVEEFVFDSGFRGYQRLNPSVSATAKFAWMAYLRTLDIVLTLIERVFGHVRGGPFVWTRPRRMAKALLRVTPKHAKLFINSAVMFWHIWRQCDTFTI